MKKRFLFFFLLPLALSCLRASNVLAEESQAGQVVNGDAQQASALMKNAQAFVEAFEKGDAKAVAAFWAENGLVSKLDLGLQQLFWRDVNEK